MRTAILVAFGLTFVLTRGASAQPLPAHAAASGAPSVLPPGSSAPPPAAPVSPAPSPPALPLAPASPTVKKEGWADRMSIRGYTQVRYSTLGNELSSAIGTNEKYTVPQDRSVGNAGGFLIRRARIIFTGDVHEKLFIYLQPDFAGASSGNTQHIAAIRDFYADAAVDKHREFRFRIGQSKVPYGWENMQSSSNRLAMDRTEAMNTATPGERDLGVFFYYAPRPVRALFKHLLDRGLKGSGDYGMLALGIHNGQGVNEREVNRNRHVVARVAYPFRVGDQIIEVATGGYTGKFRPRLAQDVQAERLDLRDARAHATFVLYPQPFGVQAEYNVGRGPELVGNAKDPASNPTVRERLLYGGYLQLMYCVGPAILFARAQHYRGGRKADENAPSGDTREVDVGVEWQIHKALELTASYSAGRRQSLSDPGKTLDGRLLRFQAQFNY